MLRRTFIKLSGAGLVALPFLQFNISGSAFPDPRESSLWIHGSPYLGHSDLRWDFRGLSPSEIQAEIAHFRTAEPWRRKILFQV